jgi:hypothetical protein
MMDLPNIKLLYPDSDNEDIKIYKLYEVLDSLGLPVKLIKNYDYHYFHNNEIKSELVDMVVIESNGDNRYQLIGFIFDQLTNRLIRVFIKNKKKNK